MVSQANYANMYDWFIGDNVANILDNGTAWVGPDNNPATNCPIQNIFNPTLISSSTFIANGTWPGSSTTQPTTCINYYQFYRNTTTNRLQLFVSGPAKCGTKKSTVEVNVEVYRSDSLFVFETEPVDTLPDVFFENNLSFEINSLGEHQGNIMNQNFSLGSPAVIDTGFFNCYAFGNGVESYKIRDSIVGNYITLGNQIGRASCRERVSSPV